MTENNFQMYSAAVTDRGLSEKRPQNEDSFLEMRTIGLFAVADGVGGAQAGDVASQMAVEILGEAFVNQQPGSDAEEVMKIAIERANSAIFQMSNDLPQLSMMATTVVALHLTGNIATIGHVGDSRIYRLDSQGTLYRETQDHSVVEEEVRAGRMTPEQAASHPSRNVISRALGAEPAVEVDLKTIMFEPNTTFLLCSDGITRHISDFELRELLLSGQDPAEVCENMKRICYDRGAEDNLTAVIVKIAGAAVGGSNGLAGTLEHDHEEATMTTARQAPAHAALADSVYHGEESPTQDLQMPAEAEEFVSVYSNADESDASVDGESTGSAPRAKAAAAAASVTADEMPRQVEVREEKSALAENQPAERKSGGFLKGVFSSLLLLLIGAAIGAAAIHYLRPFDQVQAPVATPVEPTPQYEDIPFSTYEKNRRNVDRDPATYIATFASTPPEDAADFYLLARAQMLTKNYAEAEKNLNEAKNRLPEVEETNRAVLATDIAAGLAILKNWFATKNLEKELTTVAPATNGDTANTNAMSNANGNAAPNSNAFGPANGNLSNANTGSF